MSAWWNMIAVAQKQVTGQLLAAGETWHPLPNLCLLTESEFNRWARTPSRPLIAIAAAELSISIDGQCPLLHRLN